MAPKRELNKFYIEESCYINQVNTDLSIPEHTHDFLEIVYIFKGRGAHYIDGVEYQVGAGDALFINYGSTHRFDVFGKMSYADIIIKPEFVSESLKGVENAFALLNLREFKDFSKTIDRNNCIMHFSASERRKFESIIMLAYNEQEKERAGKNLMLRSLFNVLLTTVFRKIALPMKKESGIGAELLNYIKANCTEPLTMEEIALNNHYNPSYFSRLFKKKTGYNFTEYLTSCRIDLACKLLCDTGLSIGDIATEVGFSDRTKFFRVFAQHTGTTPLKYRKSKI